MNEIKQSTTPKPSNKKLWLFSSIAVLLGLSIAIICAELSLRAMGIGKPKPDQNPKNLYYPHEDPNIGYTLRPNYNDHVFGSWVKINSQGLRDHDYTYEKPPNTKRILVLGDSVTFGYGAPQDASFTEQWEQWLNQHSDIHWQVINTGVPGWCTIQQARWFEVEGKRYNPDAVIVCYVMNDPEPVHQLNEMNHLEALELDQFYQELAEIIPKPVLPLTEQSHLLKFINRLLLHTHPDWVEIHDQLSQYFNEEIFNLPSWQEAQQSMLNIKQYCDKNNLFFQVAIYPTMYRLHSVEDHPFTQHYKTVQKTFAELDIPCIVPLDVYIGQSTNQMRAYVDDPHPGYKSHRIFAQQLHQQSRDQWDDYLNIDWIE